MPKLRWNCEKYECYVSGAGRTDLALFDACFPAGCSLSDMDGVCHLRPNFLWVEFKWDGVRVPDGQHYIHDDLVARGDVVFIVHARGEEVTEWVIRDERHPAGFYERGDLADLRHRLWAWSMRVAPERMRGRPDPGRAPVDAEAEAAVEAELFGWEQAALFDAPSEFVYSPALRRVVDLAKLGPVQKEMLGYFSSRLDAGATDHQGQHDTGIAENTWRPRRCELAASGYLVDSGRTRLVYGHRGTVWVIAPDVEL